MLVLSRRHEESIVFPSLGIHVRVLRSTRTNATIGIEAPREIAVLRGELYDASKAISSSAQQQPNTVDFSSTHLSTHQISASATAMKQIICEAAETLNQLHATAEKLSWSNGDEAMFGLFKHLKRLDAQVASLTPTAEPAVESVQEDRVIKALLVDDNQNEARLLSSYLRVKGFEVQTAFDGQEAMDQMSKHEPDVVLLDMSMPKFDGRWTIDQIRGDQSLEALTVFAVSGTNQIDSDVEVGPRGVNQWFRKPLNPESLITEISKCMPVATAAMN
ncbi:Response regulator ArlR [Rubripirellula obstinata]|uniref:Translational regulator CsrA n=1 Tax=Rubripirellula obstinata TaxID=406547 RepID=A0A5B1CTN2_9BACT|nr:response regulator [Rubripirellula obstinata]KAA1262584.1 Response regulator ArlR [Rubripirellula obstinata]